jgi:hypothetical protein
MRALCEAGFLHVERIQAAARGGGVVAAMY